MTQQGAITKKGEKRWQAVLFKDNLLVVVVIEGKGGEGLGRVGAVGRGSSSEMHCGYVALNPSEDRVSACAGGG